ncbi:MAG: amidohydrolase family protein [Verrucomicrobia bacterium]|nr:amidohydrolase family protein [Verrucomicrobiota bacterium]MDA1066982.1 amidohydrolase family protein [Verrucomicrobiota bacterium]
MANTIHDLEITDPHHHLWDLEAHYYPWLTDSFGERVCGDYAAIRKNYLLEDFQKDIVDLNVTRTVHIEAVIDPCQAVDETAWLQNISDSESSQGIPHGIVAQADFAEDHIERILDEHSQFANFRAIRDVVHEGWIDPLNPKPTKLQNSAWREAVGLCQKFGIHFELQIYYQQVEEAIELLKLHPDLPIILTHNGCPALRTPDHLEGWRTAMSRLAAHPNLYVKLSGYGMFERNWTVDSVRPLIEDTLAAFGIDRCMFASNYPVDGLACSYLDIWTQFFEVTKGFSIDERNKLFPKTLTGFIASPK